MKTVSVKMCCHSTNSRPKFFVEIGDTVLIPASEGWLQEVTVQIITEGGLQCIDVHGSVVEISAEEIKAVYIA